MNLLIAKQRNGPTGDVNLTFLKSYTRFESAAKVSDEDVPNWTRANLNENCNCRLPRYCALCPAVVGSGCLPACGGQAQFARQGLRGSTSSTSALPRPATS